MGKSGILVLCLAAACILAGCELKAAGPGLTVGSFSDEPVNTWVMRNGDGPNIIWENGIAWDPATQLLAWYGGHAWGYPQSNYTHLYDVKTNTWHDSRAPYRPQRRCLVMVNYLDSCGKVVCTQGGSGHGAIPEGGFDADYRKVVKSDPRGPWLLDVAADRWENCRTLPPIWKREAHAQCAYDASSDALVWLTGAKLGIYVPRTNRCIYRDLPKELHSRLAYAIAADPVNRKIVVFGGTGPGGWVWVRDVTRAQAYDQYIHNDTWIHDIATDKWKQAQPKASPPKGMPLDDHRFMPMVYHDASGTLLMQQTPLDKYEPDRTKWPATQLWSFDVASEQWTLVPMENSPAFCGLLAYARDIDLLFLVGGGKDGEVKDGGKVNYRPSLSKQLWTCRVQVPGKQAKPVEPSSYALAVTALTSPDQPWRPGGLVASVESPKKVVLHWNANKEKDLSGYNVYRATGKEIETGKGTALNDKPIAETSFTDDKIDLSDGIARTYWVTAVNKGGVESGASPLAYTFPDPPPTLNVVKAADGPDKSGLTVTWEWPKDVKIAGVNVYHINNHMNTHGEPADKVKAWYDGWKKVNDRPVSDGKLVFTVPAGQESRHHYFYLRAENLLGQEGFYTDIASATDKRFHP